MLCQFQPQKNCSGHRVGQVTKTTRVEYVDIQKVNKTSSNDAKMNNRTVHFATLMDLCHLKRSEFGRNPCKMQRQSSLARRSRQRRHRSLCRVHRTRSARSPRFSVSGTGSQHACRRYGRGQVSPDFGNSAQTWPPICVSLVDSAVHPVPVSGVMDLRDITPCLPVLVCLSCWAHSSVLCCTPAPPVGRSFDIVTIAAPRLAIFSPV